ncbi:hypothetical protein BJY04DRAFT_134061 [Aspergillus karnatakaensis]|uniref:PQ-loop repeat-containing protein n=1 Tax=Aspergillus karnatakaensis TaxID=1810916 RepID=UPI003CCD6B26
MAYNEVPDGIRLVLIILTALSFIPQLYRLFSLKTSTGISITYILFNLIVATEQFTNEFYIMVNVPEASGGMFTHEPLSRGDWLNFAQITVVWVLLQILFALCIFYRPTGQSYRRYIALYFLYILISVVPELLDLLGFIKDGEDFTHEDYQQHFIFVHIVLINPIVTILGGASAKYQLPQIQRQPEKSALSVLGLLVQAVVFAIVAVSWVWRVVYASDLWCCLSFEWVDWYYNYGRPVVDNAVFAGVQFTLFLMWAKLRRGGRGGRGGKRDRERGETRPLLADQYTQADEDQDL